MITWLWFSLKNVRRNGRRALITLLIAAVGMTGLLAAGGFSEYTYAALKEAPARDTGHLVLAHHDFFDGEEDAPMQHGLADPVGLQRELLRDPRVKAALPRLQLSGILTNGETSAVFVGTGVDDARKPFPWNHPERWDAELLAEEGIGDYDAVVCMYHDQGLIPLKLLHFMDGVNVTLGLPIIRTSVDHGTAYDLAGTGRATPDSLKAAIKMAAAMAKKRFGEK